MSCGTQGTPQALPIVSLSTSVTQPLQLLLDSGSSICLISKSSLPLGCFILPVKVKAVSVSGDTVPIEGKVTLSLMKNQASLHTVTFYVTSLTMRSFDGILGTDWLRKHGVILDYAREHAYVGQFSIPFGKVKGTSMRVNMCEKGPDEDREERGSGYDFRLYTKRAVQVPAWSVGYLEMISPSELAEATDLVIEGFEVCQLAGVVVGSAVVTCKK